MSYSEFKDWADEHDLNEAERVRAIRAARALDRSLRRMDRRAWQDLGERIGLVERRSLLRAFLALFRR